MGYLDRVKACNAYDPRKFRGVYVEGRRVGWVKHDFAAILERWPAVFAVTDRDVTLSPALDTFAARTEAVDAVIDVLVCEGTIGGRSNERYPVTATTLAGAVMGIDRSAAPYFGTRSFGQHVNGLVRRDGELRMWVAKRSSKKIDFPGKLDNLVAGGLPLGRSLVENLLKECEEEASISLALASRAVPVGAISLCYEGDDGMKPEVIYCYDLELPPDFQPRINDGEVEAFYEWSLDQAAEVVRDTDSFKMNCDLVIIDFLIRRGYLAPEDPEYLELVTGLRQDLDMRTAPPCEPG